jgi:signal transduction histidine kinase
MIEPGLLRVFRYFTGIAVLYFAILLAYGGLQLTPDTLTYQIQSYLNLATYLVLLGFLSWGWIRRKLKNWFLPIAIGWASFFPVFSNLIYLADPGQKDLSMLISRSWLLVPILLVPFVLTSWQYPFRYVMLLIIATTMIELSVLVPFIETINFETIAILGVPIIRAFAFGIIGHIVSLLMDTQRSQRRQLIDANIQLSEYALALEHLTETRERNRLARELHDTLAHTLSGLSVNLEAIKISLDKDDGDNIRLIDHALENTRQGLDDTRRALKSLRSQPIEEFGLLIALEKLAEYTAERSGFELITIFPSSFPAFSSDEEQTIYRIAQEALENIHKHANADHVRIRASVDKGVFKLVIQDDGIGFSDQALDDDDIYGVRGMHERAKMVNGQLSIDSDPGQGTEIEFTLELNHG